MRTVIVALWLTATLAAAMLSKSQPPLSLTVRPQMGFAPLTVTLQIRQDPTMLADVEVCVLAASAQAEAGSSSCWSSSVPSALVTRTFKLTHPDTYVVWAAAGSYSTPRTTITVLDNQENH